MQQERAYKIRITTTVSPELYQAHETERFTWPELISLGYRQLHNVNSDELHNNITKMQSLLGEKHIEIEKLKLKIADGVEADNTGV